MIMHYENDIFSYILSQNRYNVQTDSYQMCIDMKLKVKQKLGW